MSWARSLNTLSVEGPEQRRAQLNDHMDQLLASGLNCYQCWGRCCTYHANSMHVTFLEVIDIFLYLNDKKLWNFRLEKKLKATVEDFRLDYDLYLASQKNFRRTYTCPFFEAGSKGCGLPREHKPYGCLGFNPTQKNVKDGEGCGSNKELLELHHKSVENDNLEIQAALEQLKTINKSFADVFYWTKKDLPRALLDISQFHPFEDH